MTLNGANEYCNPTVENIAKEVFLAVDILMSGIKGLRLHKVKIHETPNCFTVCKRKSITTDEGNNFHRWRYAEIHKYKLDKGKIEYDDRKAKPSDGDSPGIGAIPEHSG